MAFKKAPPPTVVPDSPEEILLHLPRRKIPGVLLHQGEVMQKYRAEAVDMSDVALQLPTGSGKTLVGLMIGEWRRRKFGQRVVYLCPTRQLVNQVFEQAKEQYGLSVCGFTGRITDYSPVAKAKYQNAERIAVTTYSALFNTNPFFDTPQVIIVDDAHAAENYIAALWTLRIERKCSDHETLHAAVAGVLKPLLEPMNFTRLTGKEESLADLTWADKISTPEFACIRDEFCAVVDAHVSSLDLRHPWSMLRDHLHACQLYLTPSDILLRPLIPPTWMHEPFANANQRIFMSATLGAGGDLERMTGRRKIMRIPVPSGWDRQGIGRRYFIFPDMSLRETEALMLRRTLMKKAGRSLVLVPSDRVCHEIVTDVTDKLKFKTFNANAIEESKKPFLNEKKAVAVVANRYDGIDFPGDDCRLLFIDGLPRATNAQERFLMSRMGARVLFNERIQTRILQAIGRCTRSLEDYSTVVVSGEELPNYIIDSGRRSYLHPELQAEIEFGIEQSTNSSIDNLLENFESFLKNDNEWEEANDQILGKRAAAVQKPFPAIDELEQVVEHEIKFQEHLWQSDFESALADAARVLAGLKASELRGYRALWYYLSGSAAWLAGIQDTPALTSKARVHFRKAKEAATGISWLVRLARFRDEESTPTEDKKDVLFMQLEYVEVNFVKLGTVHDRQYDRREKEILGGLASTEKGAFENAHRLLGEMLGFDAGRQETDGSPDSWWIAGEYCFVFEDHAGAKPTSSLDTTKARQVATHPNWIKENRPISSETKILPVLVTPVSTAKHGAMPHLKNVSLWPLSEFQEWAKQALYTLRELRSTFAEPGDLVWRAEAADAFEQNTIDALSLFKQLEAQHAARGLKPVR